MSRFVVDGAVGLLEERHFGCNWRGCGSEPWHPPHMMLALLTYPCANRFFSSRRIERAIPLPHPSSRLIRSPIPSVTARATPRNKAPERIRFLPPLSSTPHPFPPPETMFRARGSAKRFTVRG
jgi:hypothetical protein